MMRSGPLLVSLVCMALTRLSAAASLPGKQYRSDYEYNGNTDAFYKLHIDTASRSRASQICDTEGAKLMVPSTQEDINQLHQMFKRFPDLGELAWVADDGAAHESAEEHPIIQLDTETPAPSVGRCDIVNRDGEVETESCYKSFPFICKVSASDGFYDPNCDVFGSGYTYNATVGSCYKFTGVALTWDEGFEECKAEGAHLVVINSEAERQVIWDLMRTAPHVFGTRAHWFFFAGFRAVHKDGGSREFRTIFNQTLEEAGCAAWSPNEPNNGQNGDEHCGSLFKNNGRFNDVTCHHTFVCICEKEVPKRV